MGRLRRITGRVAGLAILGAGTSVAVAWGLAAWVPNAGCYEVSSVHSQGSGLLWELQVRQHERPGMVRRHWWTEDRAVGFGAGLFLRWAVTPGTGRASPWPPSWWVGHSWGMLDRARARAPRIAKEGFDDARGWPVPCLWYWATDFPLGVIGGGAINGPGSPFQFTPPATVIHGGFELPPAAGNSGDSVRALPLLPIWRGLAINMAFYGVLWGLTLFGIGGARRWRRRRRGLCPRCAYDLGHLWGKGCPECGWERGKMEAVGGTA